MTGEKPTTPSVAERLARGHGELAKLVGRARELATLAEHVRRLLGSPLDRHIQVANLENGRLTLLAHSPAWASRARFIASDLVQRLAVYNTRISEIKVITRPPTRQQVPARRRAARISAPTARLLVDVANGLERGALRDGILRLARRGPARD